MNIQSSSNAGYVLGSRTVDNLFYNVLAGLVLAFLTVFMVWPDKLGSAFFSKRFMSITLPLGGIMLVSFVVILWAMIVSLAPQVMRVIHENQAAAYATAK